MRWLLFSFLGLLLCHCKANSGGTLDLSGFDATPACQHSLECDKGFSLLDLKKTRNKGVVENEMQSGGGWITHIDATTGIAEGMTAPANSYVYASFTDQGLVRSDISDDEALSSPDWDIAFRRFLIRLNSGDSGPSCVLGAVTNQNLTFDNTTAVPDSATFVSEDIIDDLCEKINPDERGQGIATIVRSYWQLSGSGGGCLKMTQRVFIVQRADGRHVKLTVLSYYNPDAQESCDSSGVLPTKNYGAANIRIRWDFLD